MKNLRLLLMVPALLAGFACSSEKSASDISYKDNVQKALEQADLKDVTVSEDKDKNTITLGGTVHSNDAKAKAGDVAKTVGGDRIVANEVSVQPVGAESEAKDIASNLDDGIENNYKAVLIANHLDKEHIDFDAKNGVLTLTRMACSLLRGTSELFTSARKLSSWRSPFPTSSRSSIKLT